MRFATFRLVGLAACVIGLAAASVSAAHAQQFRENIVRAELVSDHTEIAPGQTFWVGLRQEMPEGWHTYWRNPGDSGEPTRIIWSLPDGFSAGEIEWPAPQRLPVGPLMNFGYSDEVFLLSRITAPADLQPGQSISLAAKAEWLVCEEICIPEESELVLNLRTGRDGPGRDPLWAKEIDDVIQSLPRPWPWSAYISYDGDYVTVSLTGEGLSQPFREAALTEASFFPYDDGVVRSAAPQAVRYGSDGFSFTIEPGFRTVNEGKVPDAGVEGLVVLADALSAADKPARSAFTFVASSPAPPSDTAAFPYAHVSAAQSVTLWLALGFALLGGILLNLMPCVLPVLSVKALGLLSKSGESIWVRRRHALVYAAGVVATFVAVAGVMLALRAMGQQIGWGFQLQSPVFVVLLSYLMTLVGLNLSGAITVNMPLIGGDWLRDRDTSIAGSFGIGVLAVILATPCTVPFMATALGYAITQPPASALLVFAALGVGLAAPYALIVWSPALGRMLPKPGSWMNRMRQVLAVPMFLTAIWLLWVLSYQVDGVGLVLAVAGLIALAIGIAFAAGRFGFSPSGAGARRTVAGLSVAIALAFAWGVSTAGVQAAKGETDYGSGALAALAEPYDPEKLAVYRAQGRAVFVNFTAAWCITCKWNERSVLGGERIADFVADRNVAYMVADWTRRDGRIARVLERHGRNGVPLYLVYAPGSDGEAGAEILPQVLTEDIVLSALGNAVRDLSE